MKNFIKTNEGVELSILCIDLNYKLAENISQLTRNQINFLIESLKYRNQQVESPNPNPEGVTRIIFNNET